MRIHYTLFHCKKIFAQNHNSKYTVTSVSTAFRWAMLCTKSELRFKQYSLNHRTRNLRRFGKSQLLPYPLYRYAIVLFVFPLKVNRLFPLFTSNNALLRRVYICAFSSAQFSAYYRLTDQPVCCVSLLLFWKVRQPILSVPLTVQQQHCVSHTQVCRVN